jgi:FixJ family two-component response regulator
MSPPSLIACVEDDLSVCEAIEGLLVASGFAVETFLSAEDLLQFAGLGQVSCLITDVNLPGISGLQLQGRLAALGHDIPTIVITAFPDERVRMQALGAGAVCFLVKPIFTTNLLGCIRSILEPPDTEERQP